MSLLDFGPILVAAIAALGAWAAQRAAGKANSVNIEVSARLDAEQQAYQRARAFDIQTIERQDSEIQELLISNDSLRAELKAIKVDNQELHEELRAVKIRISRLEALYPEAKERFKHD